MMGCVTQVGPQSTNVARTAVLAAGWPESVPATTMDRQCGSSQQAVHFAAQSVMAGVNDTVVACGLEAMSTVPMLSNAPGDDITQVYGQAAQQRYADRTPFGYTGLVPQGISVEIVARDWNLSRADLDEYALRSHLLHELERSGGRFGLQTMCEGGGLANATIIERVA
jgi:acetyl-CoA acetyltransferase